MTVIQSTTIVNALLAQRGASGVMFTFAGSVGNPSAQVVEVQLTPQTSAVPPFKPTYNIQAVSAGDGTSFN